MNSLISIKQIVFLRLVLSIFIIGSISSCNNLKNIERYNGLNGKPKRVTGTYYSINKPDGNDSIKFSMSFLHVYNSQGRLQSIYTFKQDGIPNGGGMHFTYDKYGNPVKVYNKGLSGKSYLSNIYEYNEFGQQTKREHFSYNMDSISGKTTTITMYKRTGNVDSIINKISNRNITEYMIKKYDKKWREIEYAFLDSLWNLKRKTLNHYDSKNNIVLIEKFGSNNFQTGFTRIEYNDNNHPVKRSFFKISINDTTKTKEMVYKYKYDRKKNIVEERLITDGILSSIENIKYTY
jgi:hypothetical protein